MGIDTRFEHISHWVVEILTIIDSSSMAEPKWPPLLSPYEFPMAPHLKMFMGALATSVPNVMLL